jgi:hypothetical protein
MTRRSGQRQQAARRHAVDVAARSVAAIGGGYGLSYLFAGALPLWLPIARTEAVLWSALASFAVYAGIVLYAFAARSTARLWLGLAAAALLLWLAVWVRS